MEKNKPSLPSLPPRPRYPHQLSKLRVSSRPFVLHLAIEGRLSKRQRRTILQTLYREIRPMLWYIRSEWLHHNDSTDLEGLRNFKRPLSFRQTPHFHTATGNFGYLLKLRRQELGLTQENLAKAIGISRTHISKIEHGHYSPRFITFHKLQSLMKAKFHDHFEAAAVARRLRAVTGMASDIKERKFTWE